MRILQVGLGHQSVEKVQVQEGVGTADLVMPNPSMGALRTIDANSVDVAMVNLPVDYGSNLEVLREVARSLKPGGEAWLGWNVAHKMDPEVLKSSGLDPRTARPLPPKPDWVRLALNKALTPGDYKASVSLIIPGLTTTGLLDKVANSLSRTTDWSLVKEVIIVCEGPDAPFTDGNAPTTQCNYAEVLPVPVRVIWGPEPLGVTWAMRMGYEAAQGLFAAVVDDGALMEEGWLNKLLEGLVNNPSCGVVSCLPREHPEVSFMIACSLAWMPAVRAAGGPNPLIFNRGPYDDDDFQIRLAMTGFEIGAVGGAIISHALGGTTGNYRTKQDIADRWAEKTNLMLGMYGGIPHHKPVLIGEDERMRGLPQRIRVEIEVDVPAFRKATGVFVTEKLVKEAWVPGLVQGHPEAIKVEVKGVTNNADNGQS